MSLESLQVDFARAMFQPACAEALLSALVHEDAKTLQRIALYRGNIVAAWQKALANAFPVVRALVGEEFFDALARVYGHTYPSTSGDLNRFGEFFPPFVAGFEHTQALTYLADVATLEWAVHRAHYAADAEAVSRSGIAGLSPEELLAARFELHPACAWLESEFPVASIWQAHQPHSTVPLPDSPDCPQAALIARPRWRVEVVASGGGEVAALASLRSGATLEDAIGAALAADAAFDFGQALLRWLDLALLTRIHDPQVD